MCQFRFTFAEQYIPLVSDVDNGGGYAYGRDRVYKGNLYNCPLNFTLNLKLQMELKMQKKST